MRRLLYIAAAGLLLTPLVGWGHAAEPPSKPLKPAEPDLPFLDKGTDKQICHTHGTKVEFVDTPKEAAALAKKQEKLVFVLHVSGNFEDPRFT